MPSARSVRITGHVQGVFFREWTVQLAQQVGVFGWVRNRSDGSVEVYARGELDQLERFISELRSGPPAAQVENVSIEDAPLEEVAGFLRRATV